MRNIFIATALLSTIFCGESISKSKFSYCSFSTFLAGSPTINFGHRIRNNMRGNDFSGGVGYYFFSDSKIGNLQWKHIWYTRDSLTSFYNGIAIGVLGGTGNSGVEIRPIFDYVFGKEFHKKSSTSFFQCAISPTPMIFTLQSGFIHDASPMKHIPLGLVITVLCTTFSFGIAY